MTTLAAAKPSLARVGSDCSKEGKSGAKSLKHSAGFWGGLRCDSRQTSGGAPKKKVRQGTTPKRLFPGAGSGRSKPQTNTK